MSPGALAWQQPSGPSTADAVTRVLNPVGLPPVGTAQHATFSVLVLRGLAYAVEQAGGTRSAFLHAAGIDEAVLQRVDARVPRGEVFRACASACEVTANPALGLHWGNRLSERVFAPVSLLLTSCTSVGQALEMLAQYYRLLSDEADYAVREERERVLIVLHVPASEPLATRRFFAEKAICGFWQLVRSFHCDARPIAANFAHPAPAHAAEYDRVFGGAARFGQPETSLVFAPSYLGAPVNDRDDGLREALATLAEERLRRITETAPYALRVREQLLRGGWPHATDMESVAQALGCSVRSLRRRLTDEQVPYGEILAETQATIAKTLLRGQTHTIQEVAYAMGFAHPSAFHRAFKGWTGLTPSGYRAAVRQAKV